MCRFSIRDVLWLTVVVGLAIGWYRDHSTCAAAYGQMKIAIHETVSDSEYDAIQEKFRENWRAYMNEPEPSP